MQKGVMNDRLWLKRYSKMCTNETLKGAKQRLTALTARLKGKVWVFLHIKPYNKDIYNHI